MSLGREISMNQPKTTVLPVAKIIPSLLVRDLDVTLAFYERLGFAQSGAWPDEEGPAWAEVTWREASIQFHTDPPHGTPEKPILSGTLYLQTDDVADLAASLDSVVPFAWGPEVMDYGMLEFAVQDPNGYFLAFTQPA